MLKTGSVLTWCATAAGFIGLMVRWYESYLVGADIGYIPVSNLYEVFVLFSLLTALLYLHYERHYATRRLGAFVLLVISAAVGFLALVRLLARCAGDPAASAGAAKLLDEDPRAGQLRRLRLLLALGHGWRGVAAATARVLADRLPSAAVLEKT